MNRSSVAALSLFGAGAIAWAVISLPARDRSLERPMQSGVLRVAYAVEPPYAYVGADGQVTGESPELARRVIAGSESRRSASFRRSSARCCRVSRRIDTMSSRRGCSSHRNAPAW